MRRTLLSFAAATLMVALPSQVRASTASWLGVPTCTVGSIEVCVSVQDLQWDASTNRLSFTVLNLSPEAGMDHWITRIGFYHDATGTPWNGTATVVSLPNGWSLGTNAISSNGSGFELELGAGTNGIKNGIGPATSATFVIHLSEQFVFDESAQMRWHTQQVDGDGDLSIKCDTGWEDTEPGSSYPFCQAQVVPEPFSMALLGTGLAGVGGAALRRRRRKDGDVVSG